MCGLIALSTIGVFASTHYPLGQVPMALRCFELVTAAIFCAEYLVRVWCSVEGAPPGRSAVSARLAYALTPVAVVDLVAFLPSLIPTLVVVDLRTLRLVRLMRLLRVLKMSRYSTAVSALTDVIRLEASRLGAVVVAVCVVVVLSASLVFFTERSAQPAAFPHMTSALWWAVATLSTVGYGDVYPITPLGKFIAGTVAVLGVGLFAVPAGIIASAYQHRMQTQQSSTGHLGGTERQAFVDGQRAVLRQQLGSSNADFYTASGLRRARRHLADGGILGIWSYAEHSPFASALREVFDDVRVEPVTIARRLAAIERGRGWSSGKHSSSAW